MSRPNILLIVLDATRADACSCYGASRPTTPSLDAVAEEGTLYEQAVTAAPWTLPAFASLFTGLYPSQLGIEESRRLDMAVPTLAGVLGAHGYATFGVTGNIWLGDEFGLTRGFDQVHKLWQLFQASEEMSRTGHLAGPGHVRGRASARRWLEGNPLRNVLNAAYGRWGSFRRDYGASRTSAALLRWLRARQGPWFACVHYLEAHLEYRPPRKWAQRMATHWPQARALLAQDQWRRAWRHMAGVEPLAEEELAAWRELYLAEVAYADGRLGELLAQLRASGALDHTLLVITGDHGESLGEHGLLNHQYAVHDPLLRVPLVIRCPGLFPAGARVSWQVQTLDLFRTLLEAAGVEPPPSSSRGLHPAAGPRRPFTVSEYGVPRLPDGRRLRRYGLRPQQIQPFLRGLTALRTEEQKLVEGSDGCVALYHWRRDPGEDHDLAGEKPDQVRELRGLLRRFREEHGSVLAGTHHPEGELDPETAARLRGLGYIA